MRVCCGNLWDGSAEFCTAVQVEEAAGASQHQLASHVEELERQLEGAAHDVDEWRQQTSDANEHAQQLRQQLQELSARAERSEVGHSLLPEHTREGTASVALHAFCPVLEVRISPARLAVCANLYGHVLGSDRCCGHAG